MASKWQASVSERQESAPKRQANFELLRIVAMLAIIALHYMIKGDVAQYDGNGWSPLYCVLQLMKAFCIPLINCYVLLSGFFMADAKWRPHRIVSLFLQVLFYSLLIPLVMIGTGALSWKDLGLYDWIGFLLPIGTEHYWFATAYLYLYIFAPLLAAGVSKMEKKTLQMVIAAALFFFSFVKSVVPVSLVMDRAGYDYGWFLCLFLIAAYWRRYGIEWLDKRRHGIRLYMLMCFAVFALAALAGVIVEKTGKLAYYEEQLYTYNHILVLLASLGLFAAFKNLCLREGRAAYAIRRLAPYTFGVYLLHEHMLVRYEWQGWLQIEKVKETWLFIPHMAVCILLIYLVGTVTDFVRAYLFEGIVRKWRK